MPIRFVSSHNDGGVVSIPVFFSMEAMFGTSSDSTLGCLFCIKQGVRGRQGVVTWLNTSLLHLESFILGKRNQDDPTPQKNSDNENQSGLKMGCQIYFGCCKLVGI